MTIKIWDLDSMEVLKVLQGHTDYINMICKLHDKNKIASCSNDGKIKIWNWKKEECV